MQIKSFWRHAVELVQSSFGIRPKTFYSVDMNITDGENIVRVIDSQMFGVAHINQSVVAAPAIRINYRIKRDLAANNVLQRFLSRVRDNLGKNRAVAFVNSKDVSSIAKSRPNL